MTKRLSLMALYLIVTKYSPPYAGYKKKALILDDGIFGHGVMQQQQQLNWRVHWSLTSF